MANDATRGVGNSSAQTVDDHVPREWEDPQAKRCGGMERSGSLCGRGCRSAEADVAPLEEIADPRKPMRLQRGRPCRSAGVLRGVLPLRSARADPQKEDDHCGHPHTEKINWISAIWLRGCQGIRPGRSGPESWPGRCDEAVAGREPSAQRTASSAEALELTAHR